MKQFLRKTGLFRPQLLMLLFLMGGSGLTWAQSYQAVASFRSTDVVTNQAYNPYSNDDWSITCGGYNKSVGSNQIQSAKCKITSNYGTSVNTSHQAAAILSKNKISNVSQIRFSYSGGSGNSGVIYLAYSTDNSEWNAITLTNGSQGASVTTPMTFNFETIEEAYYAIILSKGTEGTSDFRWDDVIVTFNKATNTSLTANDLAITNTSTELSFDLNNGASSQVINYTTSSTGAISVSDYDYVTTSVDEVNKTITVTPNAVTNGAQTITINQEADENYAAGSVTFTVTITDSTPIPTHTATFSVNGETTSQDFQEGASITFPSNPPTISGKAFWGWTDSAINGTTNDQPNKVTTATMGNSDVTYYAVFADKTEGSATTLRDVLDSEFTGSTTNNSYLAWSNKKGNSTAVYAGNSAGGNSSIQLRTTNGNSGIVTTKSGGNATKVSVTWNSSTNSSRKVNIYGKNTAYTSASDLYSTSTQGTLIGSITYGSKTLTITGDYAYIGIRSNDGAIYLTDVSIDWATTTPDTYANYCTNIAVVQTVPSINVSDTQVVFGSTYTIDDTQIEGGDITVTSSNTAVATVNGLTITPVAVGETTITVATAENMYYYAGSGTFQLTVTPPEGLSTSVGSVVFNETWDKTNGTGGHDNSFSGNIASSNITSDEEWTISSGGGAKQCLKLGIGTDQTITTRAIELTGDAILTFSAAGWATGSNTFVVTATGATLSGDTEVNLEASTWNNYIVNITNVTGDVTLTFTGTRGFLDDVKVTTIPTYTVKLNASGYTTYCSEYPLDFSSTDGFTAWQVTAVENNVITFERITEAVKGGTGVLLKGTAGETVTLSSTNSNTVLADNKLVGTLAPTCISAREYYGLSGKNFVKVNAGTIPAHKALLPARLASEENQVKSFTFVFDDLTTGIQAIETVSAEEAAKIFDLSGRRLSKPTKGINIINGKKVLVK